MASARWRNQAAAIDALLSERHSPLANLGMFFVAYGSMFGVDGRLAVAIAGAETSFGTDPGSKPDIEVHNAWGYGHPPSASRGKSFPTWREGIAEVSRSLGVDYVHQRGLEGIEEIGARWVGRDSPEWVATVRAVYRQLGGNPDGSVRT